MTWLGVDLGGTWLRTDGAAPERTQGRTPEQMMSLLAERAHAQGCQGVAISFAGWLNPDGRGIEAGPNLGWGRSAWSEGLAAYDLLCHLENDVDARAWGEWLALGDRGQASGDLLVINAGTGFALGLVIAGRVCRGVHRRAGEVGHVRPGLDARCGCGAKGCVETVLGGAHHQPDTLDDEGAQRRWLETAVSILAPVICALDPATIIATGGILDHRADLRRALEAQLMDALPVSWWGDLKLEASIAGDLLARRGVVDLARRSHGDLGEQA